MKENHEALMDMTMKKVKDIPDYLYLTYAVCTLGENPCGWEGWVIDSIFKKSKKNYNNATGDKSLRSIASYSRGQVCPKCGSIYYRTEVEIKMIKE